ncbi:hypothetical protein VUR80DRAFT_4445 [Thermomyces stellatus]
MARRGTLAPFRADQDALVEATPLTRSEPNPTMASDKELPVLPLRTGSVRGLDRAKESPYQCVYEDPRALWVHHRKTSQGDAGLGGVYEPAQGHDRRARHYYPQYRQPSRDGHSGLGITVSVSGHGHGPQLRRTAHTLTPRDTLLPPSPES